MLSVYSFEFVENLSPVIDLPFTFSTIKYLLDNEVMYKYNEHIFNIMNICSM